MDSEANGPSEHLTWRELACKDGTPYPNKWRSDRAIYLAVMFELIRDHFGNKPIKVNSGYRTSDYNKEIGGARNSQHVLGRALDLNPPKNVTIKQFYDGIKEVANKYENPPLIGGIGLYKNFVHVDIRNSEKVVYWKGNGVKDSLA